MPDINTPLTEEQLAHYREAKRLLDSPTLQEIFRTLKAAYIDAWESSDIDPSTGEARSPDSANATRGMLWIKVKCLEDLQFELGAYASRAEVAEMAGQS